MNNKPLYNIDSLREMVGNNQKELNLMVQMFVDLTPVTLDEMKNASLNENWKGAGDAAHKLKSSLPIMGIETLVPFAIEIEQEGRNEINTNALKNKVYTLESNLLEIVNQIKIDFNI